MCVKSGLEGYLTRWCFEMPTLMFHLRLNLAITDALLYCIFLVNRLVTHPPPKKRQKIINAYCTNMFKWLIFFFLPNQPTDSKGYFIICNFLIICNWLLLSIIFLTLHVACFKTLKMSWETRKWIFRSTNLCSSWLHGLWVNRLCWTLSSAVT